MPNEGDPAHAAPAILRSSTMSRFRRRAPSRARCWSRPTPSASAGPNCWCAAASIPGCRRCRLSPASRWPARWPSCGAEREPLCRRPEGLCHGARTAGPRRLLRRIHRGAGARAVRAAAGRGSGGGGMPVELSGGLASAAHRDPRRAGPERADRLGVGRARQRRGAACQARRDDGDRRWSATARKRARSRRSAPITSSTRAARMSRPGSRRSPAASASISSSTRSAARISRNSCRCSGRSACWCPTASSSARSRQRGRRARRRAGLSQQHGGADLHHAHARRQAGRSARSR